MKSATVRTFDSDMFDRHRKGPLVQGETLKSFSKASACRGPRCGSGRSSGSRVCSWHVCVAHIRGSMFMMIDGSYSSKQ